MSRQAELLDEIRHTIIEIALKKEAIWIDNESDDFEFHSNLDEEADEATRRAVMRAWRNGKLLPDRKTVQSILEDVLGTL